jgi:ribosome-associated protein
VTDQTPATSGRSSTSPRADGLPRRGARPAPQTADRSPGGRSPLEDDPLGLARRIVELAEDKKAADIVLLDLSELTTLADHFVICSAGSERQLDAIADGVIEGLRADGVRPIGREGVAASHWVLLDYGSVIVHVFTPPERDYYQLEKRWSEAKTILRVQ